MLSLRVLRTVKSAIGLLLCASLLFVQMVAQQPPAAAPDLPPPQAVFSVTTTLVQVDAVVTDSKGRYVSDLTADDFAVYEDGKPQTITNFSYVRVSSPLPAGAKPEGKPSPKSLPPAPSAPVRPEDIRRTIVLMVDDLGLSFETMAFVRSSLRKFVERQMEPGDLVAVCRTAAGTGSLQQFTTDKRILLSIIDGLHWNPNGRAGLSFFDPAQPVGTRAGARKGSAGSLDPSYDVGRNSIFTVGTLGAVDYIVGALRELPGRKSIVLFSDGLMLFTPAQGPIRHTGMDSEQTMESNGEIVEALRRLVDRANRSGTVIYTMHTAGLQTLQPDAQDRVGPISGNPQEQAQQMREALRPITQAGAPGGRDVAFNAGQQGLAHLALETGGLPYENGNDLNWGLDRVLADQQGYYLIGFKPAQGTFDEKHGKRNYHHFAVKVTRPHLHVRSRSGSFGETDEEATPKYSTPLEQLRAGMLSPFRSSQVRLRLTALYAEVPKHGPVVRNLLHIDTADLTFDGATARVEIVAVATSMGDTPVAMVARGFTIQAQPDRFQEAVKEGALYALDVPVKKRGAYQIRVAVRDTATGKVGSASQFLEIPELKRGRVALTSVLLQNAERPDGAPAWTGMSPATRQFRSGSQMEYFCLLENLGKKVAAADLNSQIHIVRDGRDIYSGPARLVPIDGGGLAVTGKLKLGVKMTPGDYYLGIMAAGAVQWTDFEVLP